MNTPTDLPLSQLKQYWGYDSFRPLQREAIDCALQKRDSVVVLPTGGGKSLCYQIPALCTDKVAVVVSPLISLMKDQVDSLVANGINAASINSSMSDHDKANVADQIRSGKLQLLYLAPERLVLSTTIRFLQDVGVAFFAIDEAHCISSWGHDFRPEYRQLSSLKENFPQTSVHAFTATATEQVRADIAKQLNLTAPEMLVGSFDRDNLLYRVHRRSDALTQLREVVDRFPKQSGIVYCISRKEVENVSATLNHNGYRSLPYHAGLSSCARSKNQDDFINERTDIVVATVAFGMGIDKSNVRYVVHMGMPKSIEAYQQESGRAGRDGLQSECTLLFSGADFMVWKKMTDASQPAAKELLEAMYGYCNRSLCRHRMLVEYFGQSLKKKNCGACDVCLGELNTVPEPQIVAQKIISCVHRVDQRFGANHVALVLTGSSVKRILELRHNQLSTYGLLSEHSKTTVVDWIQQLIGQEFLAQTGDYNVLTITPSGRQVLKDEIIPELYQTAPPATKTSSARDDWAGVDDGLFNRLRELRRTTAEEKRIPPFVIFHDASLREMARQRPSTVAAFGTIPGVGERKRGDYGEAFVARIVEYCTESKISMDQTTQRPPVQKTSRPKAKLLNDAKLKAFHLFETNKPLSEVAEQIGRAKSTVTTYLTDYIREQKIVDPTRWLASADVEKIRAAVQQVGNIESISPMKRLLGDDITYDQIRIVVECIRAETS
jgi:ATP-dependent DNA helicase RecQ